MPNLWSIVSLPIITGILWFLLLCKNGFQRFEGRLYGGLACERGTIQRIHRQRYHRLLILLRNLLKLLTIGLILLILDGNYGKLRRN